MTPGHSHDPASSGRRDLEEAGVGDGHIGGAIDQPGPRVAVSAWSLARGLARSQGQALHLASLTGAGASGEDPGLRLPDVSRRGVADRAVRAEHLNVGVLGVLAVVVLVDLNALQALE